MQNITPQYIAGVADADGSFSLVKRTAQSTINGIAYRSIFQLSWAPCKEAEIVMQFLKNTYGGSYSICNRANGLNSKHSTTLKYSVEGKKLAKLIDDIEPYLVLKKERAKILRQHLQAREESFIGRVKPTEMWEKEEKAYLAMNKLNSKNNKK